MLKSDSMKCRICDCTNEDCSECIELTGMPCHWVEDDLCSACVGVPGGFFDVVAAAIRKDNARRRAAAREVVGIHQ